MSDWHVVYRADTGESVSVGTDDIGELPSGLAVADLSDSDAAVLLSGDGVWDAAARAVVIPPPPVPAAVEAYKLRKWLIEHDHDPDAVSAAIQAMSDVKQRRLALNDWEYSTSYPRRHPLMPAFLQVTGLTDEQADQAFREASAYP